ncbi:MAG: zf-HC2 domain-containing protein [Gammaproteobacteria bacterium]|nr:zf-HC2 domain-containing protein [Gammaproteobacteria bacterium]
MFNCKQLSALSSDYLDGKLTSRQKLSVRFHTLMCKYCRRFLAQLSMVAAFLPENHSSDGSAEEIESQLKRLLSKPDHS